MTPRTAAAAVTGDPVTTWLALTVGASEAHPLWAGLVHRFGITGGLAVRAAAGLIVIVLLARLADRRDDVTARIWAPLTVVFGLIACWNLGVAAITAT